MTAIDRDDSPTTQAVSRLIRGLQGQWNHFLALSNKKTLALLHGDGDTVDAINRKLVTLDQGHDGARGEATAGRQGGAGGHAGLASAGVGEAVKVLGGMSDAEREKMEAWVSRAATIAAQGYVNSLLLASNTDAADLALRLVPMFQDHYAGAMRDAYMSGWVAGLSVAHGLPS